MLGDIKRMISVKNIDGILENIKNIKDDEVEEAIELLTAFYDKELGINTFIYNFLQNIKDQRDTKYGGEKGLKIITVNDTQN